MKKVAIAIVVLLAVAFVVRKTHVDSYVRTFCCQVGKEVKSQVPTRFEIDRARHEIANLEGDIGNMIKPIAEYMAAVNRLKKDISFTEAKLEEQKGNLLELTKRLEGNPAVVSFGGEKYSAERVRLKLQRDFDCFKRLEGHCKSQHKLLEAKEISLRGAQDQLSKVIAKKREFELRLAQLEADEETLQVVAVGSSVQFDDTRATQIEAALAEIERRHDVQRAEATLKSGVFANDIIPTQAPAPSPDVETIRQYLEGASVQ